MSRYNMLASDWHSQIVRKTLNNNMSPSSLHLSYFAIPGRAELTRLLLAYGNVDFRDTQYTFEEYATAKSTLNLPFG